MRKNFLRIMVAVLVAWAISGCTRHTCPVYVTSFPYGVNAPPHQFFAYFQPEGQGDAVGSSGGTAPVFADMVLEPEPLSEMVLKDTVMNNHGLLVFPEGEEPSAYAMASSSIRNRNGLMVKKKAFMGGLLHRKPQQPDNFNRVVNTRNPRPFKPVEMAEDSTHQLVQRAEPPKLLDQFFYEMVFGTPGQQEADEEPTQVEETDEDDLDEALSEEDEANLSKKEKRKRRKAAKKKEKERQRLERMKKNEPEPADMHDISQPAGEQPDAERPPKETASSSEF